jgi:hypothetical protein
VLAGEQPRNQIFLSASQRQANKFRREIVGWVKRVTGVELTGNPIMLDFAGLAEDGPALDGVGLYPLSTNSNTAQGERRLLFRRVLLGPRLRPVAQGGGGHGHPYHLQAHLFFDAIDQDP